MTKQLKWILMGTGAFSIIACSQLDDMKKNSNDLKTNSDALAANSERLTDNALSLMYGSATVARQDILESMESANTLRKKSIIAGTYMGAFDYQLVRNIDPRNPNRQKAFFHVAIKQLTADFLEYFNKDYLDFGTPTDGVPMGLDGKTPLPEKEWIEIEKLRNAYALAIALHHIHPDLINANKNDEKVIVVSMFDLVIKAIDKLAGVKQGQVDLKVQPEYVKQVNRGLPALLPLLKLRYNYLLINVMKSIESPADRVAIDDGIKAAKSLLLARGAMEKMEFDFKSQENSRMELISRKIQGIKIEEKTKAGLVKLSDQNTADEIARLIEAIQKPYL